MRLTSVMCESLIGVRISVKTIEIGYGVTTEESGFFSTVGPLSPVLWVRGLFALGKACPSSGADHSYLVPRTSPCIFMLKVLNYNCM
jgi:hypothetical protein